MQLQMCRCTSRPCAAFLYCRLRHEMPSPDFDTWWTASQVLVFMVFAATDSRRASLAAHIPVRFCLNFLTPKELTTGELISWTPCGLWRPAVPEGLRHIRHTVKYHPSRDVLFYDCRCWRLLPSVSPSSCVTWWPCPSTAAPSTVSVVFTQGMVIGSGKFCSLPGAVMYSCP